MIQSVISSLRHLVDRLKSEMMTLVSTNYKKKIVSIRFDEKKKREMKPDNFLLIVIKAYKSKISF